MEPVALAEVLAECRAMIEPLAAQRGIRLLFPDDVARCACVADRTRLKQVLLNLLSNAVKYNREGGARGASTARQAAPERRAPVGAGHRHRACAPTSSTALFQPFNRLGQEDGAEEGTGIGLVVTQRLVELMGGDDRRHQQRRASAACSGSS